MASTLAIPVVVFGAVSLIQQAQQANEDRSLRLKAIQTHNLFLSQEDNTPKEVIEHPAANLVLNSDSAPDAPPNNSQSRADEPDYAAPAMLDQPERPEPSTPQAPDQTPADKSSANVPPQTAVLDRPERAEPDSVSSDPAISTHSDVTTQQTEPQLGSFMANAESPARPYSPGTGEQVSQEQHLLVHCLVKTCRTHSAHIRGNCRDSCLAACRVAIEVDQFSKLAQTYVHQLSHLPCSHPDKPCRAELSSGCPQLVDAKCVTMSGLGHLIVLSAAVHSLMQCWLLVHPCFIHVCLLMAPVSPVVIGIVVEGGSTAS